MKIRFFAVLLLSIMALNLGAVSFADTKAKSLVKAQNAQLVSHLPASDGVVTLDAKRFFNDALPKILSSNQPMLDKVLGKVNEVQAETGIDLRQFEYVVAGLAARKIAPKKYDVDPVVLARGQVDANAVIAAAKQRPNITVREERVGGKPLYIFSGKDVVDATNAGVATPDAVAKKASEGIAVAAFDSNTLAIGTPARVRQALEGTTRVGADVTGLLDRTTPGVVNFAAKVPEGMSAFVPLDNDELGRNIDSIRYMFGSMDVNGVNAIVNLTARTQANAQAQGLYETLDGLRILGKAFLGGARGADKQVYARMIDNVKFSVRANEVTMDLQVPQSDIDVLVGMLK